MRKALEMRGMAPAPAGSAPKQLKAKVDASSGDEKEVSDSGKYKGFDYGIE
jgi:hypothetical protein